MGNYSEPASSSDSTCAFFARLRARLQSVIRAASRASLMKPLIFEIKSDCAAFRFFPRADSRLQILFRDPQTLVCLLLGNRGFLWR